jgi:hypothetical protein
MYDNLGIDKLSHRAPRVRAGLARNSHDNVRGPGLVDQFIQALDGPQDGNRGDLRMEGEMPAAGSHARSSGMTSVYKADNRRTVPRFLTQSANQSTSVPPGSDQ